MARVIRSPGVVAGEVALRPSPIVVEVGRARVSVVAGFDQAALAAVLDVLGAREGAR